MFNNKGSNTWKNVIREIYAFIYELQQNRKFVTQAAHDGNDVLLIVFKETPPWAHLYFRSSTEIVITALTMIGMLDRMVNAAKAENRVKAVIELLREARSEEFGKELDILWDSTDINEKSIWASLLFATLGNLDANAAFEQTMDKLVKEAATNDAALFKAVLIDPTVVTLPHISERIRMAHMRTQKKFMKELAGSINKRKKRRRVRLDDMRMMLSLMDEIVGLDSVTHKEIAEALIDDLKLYSNDGEDPEAALKKNVQRSKKSRGK
jgi:hypothetical protein